MVLGGCLRRKPFHVIAEQAAAAAGHDGGEHRVYGFCSLLAVGVGGAVGSGIFVLSGEISVTYAGPATCLSWLIGGAVCAATALAYAELSCVVPSAGSTYSFAYFGLGEVFAVLGAWFLSIEYGMASAAVARSWGDKVAFYASDMGLLGCGLGQPPGGKSACWINSLGGSQVNVAAFALFGAVVLVVNRGVSFAKNIANVLVALKVSLVLFVIVAGASHFNAANVRPFIVPEGADAQLVGGWRGVLTGTTTAFFGFIGFDEVCCLSLEAVRPKRDVPLAVLGTIAVITVLYVLASLVLTGMVHYSEIDSNEGFGSAFRKVGAAWAFHIVMLGQILVVLPAVVLLGFMPQARLLASLARDGLLPRRFARADARGSLVWGNLSAGAALCIVALLVPFRRLNDLISGGILLAFQLTNASLLVVRCGNDAVALVAVALLVVLTGLCAATLTAGWYRAALGMGLPAAAVLLALLPRTQPRVEAAGPDTFAAPGVPIVPGLALLANWCLVAEIEPAGLTMLGVLIAVALAVYAAAKLGATLLRGHGSPLVEGGGGGDGDDDSDDTPWWQDDYVRTRDAVSTPARRRSSLGNLSAGDAGDVELELN
jgi:APA family basic amino acid/polyamine antiporter